MSEEMTFTLVLTGGRTGKTCICGKFQFVNGEMAIRGGTKGVGGLTRYMGRTYAAFPKGSEELAKAQEKDRGNPNIDTGPGSGPADEVPSNVQPDGPTDETPTPSDGATGGGDTTTEHVSEGDGHENARIVQALSKLDHDNDEHWTQGGKPAVHVVSELLNTSVSRADIDVASSDFKREGS